MKRHSLSMSGGPRSVRSYVTPWLPDESPYSGALAVHEKVEIETSWTWMASCSCGSWSDGPAHHNTLRSDWGDHVKRAVEERRVQILLP